MEFLRSRNGQSVIEILIAVALLGIMAASSFMLMSTSFSESLTSEQRARAQTVLSDGFEAARQIRNQDFSLLATGTHGLSNANGVWSFSGTEDVVNGTFHRRVDVQSISDSEREVTVTVTWTTRTGRAGNLSATTRLTDWQTPIIPSAPNCYGYTVTGDWTHPVVLGSADIGAGNQGTDVVVDWPYAYMSGVAASSAKPDLFVFDVSNPASPTLVKSIDIGAGGINSLSLSGDYLFAASANDSKELIVFDVSNPPATHEIAHTDPTGTADGLSVIAKGNLVVLGRATSANAETYFYDLSTPTMPSLLKTFDVSGDVNDFATSESYVYAVTSVAVQDLLTFDVTNPLSPTLLGTYALNDGTQDISVAYQDPDVLFVGNAANQFLTVDDTDATNPVKLSTTSTNGQVKDMACTNANLLFLGTTDSNKEFMIYDISNLNAISQTATLNFPQVVSGIDFVSNMVFAAVRSNDALRIITSSP